MGLNFEVAGKLPEYPYQGHQKISVWTNMMGGYSLKNSRTVSVQRFRVEGSELQIFLVTVVITQNVEP